MENKHKIAHILKIVEEKRQSHWLWWLLLSIPVLLFAGYVLLELYLTDRKLAKKESELEKLRIERKVAKVKEEHAKHLEVKAQLRHNIKKTEQKIRKLEQEIEQEKQKAKRVLKEIDGIKDWNEFFEYINKD